MTSILFVRQPHVYLPEISAYRQYLQKHYPQVECFESTDMTDYNPEDYDVLWHFMGLDLSGKGKFVVHEYNSLSTRPHAKLKNIVKRFANKRPDRRIYLNKRVRQDFNFKDNIPYNMRDMGVDERFYSPYRGVEAPEFDFIYVGGLDRGPVITRLLDRFKGALSDASVLVVGTAPEDLRGLYKSYDNIRFYGRVAYEEVPALLAKAKYGLNIMPDLYPFNVQTSTKVLEYCASGIPVVTTDYEWINQFEREQGAAFFKLSANMDNLTLDALANFSFRTPDMVPFKWENIIAESGLFKFLD